MPTTDLDPDAFPYLFECDCVRTAEVTHEDAVEAVPPGIEATTRQAVDRALRSKGWWEVRGEKKCPECAEDVV